MPPGSSKKTSAWDQPSSRDSGISSSQNYNELTRVARTLAEHGGSEVAFDLALDLVLNEAVEQARAATGATAAAIALEREGEMVCRATSGAHAPGLGVRVETASGLSGACLQTGQVQHCDDTESDARVNTEACRELGVRSIVVVPLSDSNGPFGILELFSDRPNAFGERDIAVLQAFAQTIEQSKKTAEGGQTEMVSEEQRHDAPENEKSFEDQQPSQLQRPVSEAVESSGMATREWARQDLWTSILAILVIAAAISLGVVIGWRGALDGFRIGSASKPETPPVSSTTNRLTSPAYDSKNTVPETSDGSSRANSTAALKAPNALEPSRGGLVVTTNGKVVFRAAPSQLVGSPATPTSDAAATRLIRRVEPEYPAEAQAQRIQGRVVLDVQVLGNGTVGNIEVAEGNSLLAEAAVHAVRQWKYQPYFVDGQPVQSQTRITIRFSLPSS